MSLEVTAVQPGFLNVLTASLGAQAMPAVSHAIVGSFAILACLVLLIRRQVIQVPNVGFASTILIFLGVLFASLMNSRMEAQSIQELIQWSLFVLAMFVVVSGAGRQNGPVGIIGAIFLGVVIVARNGIVEYQERAALDPSWRIFAGWQQPNALAGILLIGLLLGVGIVATQRRPWALASAICSLGIAYAMFRTQSKGGVLALAAGLALLATLFGTLKFKPKVLPWVGRLAVALLLAANVAAIVVPKMPSTDQQAIATEGAPGSPGVLGRLSTTAGSSEQSVGFRKLLYVSSLRLISDNPVGSGIGTFRGESSKPGLVTQTRLAHNTLLQLAVEASPVAPILLILALALWFELTLRDAGNLPWKINALRMSVVAAVFATMIHGITESNLYTFGIGMTFFMLMGVGLQLSADAVSPEFTPTKGRILGSITVAIVAVGLWHAAAAETLHSIFRGQLQAGAFRDAMDTLEQLKEVAPRDGETWSEAATISTTPQEHVEAWKRAAELQPMPKNYRPYASSLVAVGQIPAAIGALDEALLLDPNNTPALLAKMTLENQRGDQAAASATAERLIAVEQTIYFRVRALPDLIPTETYEARLYLAKQTNNPQTRAALLKGAVDGYGRYLVRTWPSVKGITAEDPHASWGGDNLAKATANLKAGQDAALELAALYRSMGKAAEATAADASAVEFAKALVPDPVVK